MAKNKDKESRDPLRFLKELKGKALEVLKLQGEYGDPILIRRGVVREVFNLDTDIPEIILRKVAPSGGDMGFLVHVHHVGFNKIYGGFVDITTSYLFKVVGEKAT